MEKQTKTTQAAGVSQSVSSKLLAVRPIKFRGLNRHRNWIYGFYYQQNCMINGKTYVNHMIHNGDDPDFVEPETVGQFTGLCDKNGREIYEGDIMKSNFPLRNDIPDNLQIVEWNESESCFIAKDKEGFRLGNRLHPIWWGKNCEVVGNIHENADLLEHS